MKTGNKTKVGGLLLTVFLLFATHSGFAQWLSKEAVKADMDFMKKRFEAEHPGLYLYQSVATYDTLYRQLVASLPDSMLLPQALHAIGQLVAGVQDGHTAWRTPYKPPARKLKTLPLIVRPIENSIRIAYNLSSDTTLKRGDKLVALEGQPVATLVNQFMATIGSDANQMPVKQYYAERLIGSYFYKYYGPKESVSIQLQRADSVFSRRLPTATSNQTLKLLQKRYKNAVQKNMSLTVVDSTRRAALLTINSFMLSGGVWDIGQWKFKRLLKKRFKEVEQKGINHLIIDFRGNGGGFIPNIHRFLRYVAPHDFQLLDTTFVRKAALRRFAPPYTLLPPLVMRLFYKPYGKGTDLYFHKPRSPKVYTPVKQHHYSKELYFLHDGGSYSATTFTLGLAYDMGIGTYIGSQVGGANWGSFAMFWNDFKLPNTKMQVHMPLFQLRHRLPQQRLQQPFLRPDYEVGSNLADFLQREDTALKFTLGLIRNRKP